MKRIITIGRQSYSGGAAIAKELSHITGIPFYDRDAFIGIAENNGIHRDIFDKADEQATSSFLYSLAVSNYNGALSHLGAHEGSISDRVFSLMANETKKLASEQNCIFIGRCADDILAGAEGLLRVFIYAPTDYRVLRYKELNGDNGENVSKIIQKSDKKRASYYNFYTGKAWGDRDNYDICINSSVLGIEGTARLIAKFAGC